VLVPLNARLAPAELALQLRSAGVSILIADPALLDKLAGHEAFPPDIESIALGQAFDGWRFGHSALSVYTLIKCKVPVDHPAVRRGVISMAHAWGGAPSDDDKLRTIGSNTGRLSSNRGRLDRRSGQPLMSAIPVNLRRVAS